MQVAAFRAGDCDGLVLDLLLGEYLTTRAATCDLTQVGNVFYKQSIAIGIRRGPDMDGVRGNLTTIVSRLRDEDVFNQFRLQYFLYATECGTDGTSTPTGAASFTSANSVALLTTVALLAGSIVACRVRGDYAPGARWL